MSQPQRHQEVVNKLVKDIFTGKWKPGAKLPTERNLSQEMGLDRTSLRIALKQLESMQLLDIRQGDGIYVKDYLKNASLDFLRTLFAQIESGEAAWTVDQYTIDEVWEFWTQFAPLMLRMASKRVTARDIKPLMDLVDRELECVDDLEQIVDLNVREEDMIAQATNNIVVILFSNTTRPIRKIMVEAFFKNLDTETIRQHIEIKKILLKEYLSTNVDVDAMAQKYGEVLKAHRMAYRQIWRISQDDARAVEKYENTMKAVHLSKTTAGDSKP